MPSPRFLKRAQGLALAASAVALITACGRQGDLEPPGAPPTPDSRHAADFHHENPKIVPPKKDFVLDPLLQ